MSRAMDSNVAALQAKYNDLLRQVMEVAVHLSRAEGRFQGVPHYSEIESWAHEVEREASRRVQMRLMGEVLAQQPSRGRSLHRKGRS